MREAIVSDTSCLILLEKIGELDLLEVLFRKIVITPDIAEEYRSDLPPWILIMSPENAQYQKILEGILDRGEASAIALAVEQPDCLLIIDDAKARKYAQHLSLKVTGTLGVIILAKQKGIIASVKPILKKVRETDFRITEELEFRVLQKSGEE
jgi:predicted nucleic acid-binding protein